MINLKFINLHAKLLKTLDLNSNKPQEIHQNKTPGPILNKLNTNRSFVFTQRSNDLKRSTASCENLIQMDRVSFKIKAASKPLNLKILEKLASLKYTKFYFWTIWAMLEAISIVHSRDFISFNDWYSMILFISQNQLKILSEINDIQYKILKNNFDKK